jgi:hypothetical protein
MNMPPEKHDKICLIIDVWTDHVSAEKYIEVIGRVFDKELNDFFCKAEVIKGEIIKGYPEDIPGKFAPSLQRNYLVSGIPVAPYKIGSDGHTYCNCGKEDCYSCQHELSFCIVCGDAEGSLKDKCILRFCSICHCQQVHTPSGWTCINGHGGAPKKE